MANNKTGFSYYSIDTDRYQDIRIKRLLKEFKANGIAVYDYICNEIYRVKGSFIEWDASTVFDAAEHFDLKESTVNEIVNYCCFVGLFSKELLTNERELTSPSIQKRFVDWRIISKRKAIIIPERLNILPEEYKIIQEEYNHSSGILPQSKEKKRKVKNVATGVPPQQQFPEEKASMLFQMFKNCSNWKTELILEEIGKFKNKYPDLPVNKSGPVVNSWVANYKEKNTPKKQMVI